MSEERKKILEMLAEGKVSPDEANDLLNTVEKGETTTITPRARRLLKIRVSEGGEEKVNVTLPLALARVAMKFVPEDAKKELDEQGIDVEELLSSISTEIPDGKLVDVKDGDDSVEIFIE